VDLPDDRQRLHRRAAPGAKIFSRIDNFFGASGTKKRPPKRVERGEVADEVQRAIGELKEKFRLPILLKYSEGLSYEEIAKVLDCSTGTVASRLNRGHKMLAQKLKHLKAVI
jgi:RNA polymerase sigma factor (sigma-70 family)